MLLIKPQTNETNFLDRLYYQCFDSFKKIYIIYVMFDESWRRTVNNDVMIYIDFFFSVVLFNLHDNTREYIIFPRGIV